MNDCPQCGNPMVWSFDHERIQCAIYGTHDEPVPQHCQCADCLRDARWARARETRRLRAVS